MSDTGPTRTRRGLDLQTAGELADLLVDLSQDPATRRDIAKAIRAKAPDSPHARAFTDIDADDKIEAFKREQEEREFKRMQDAHVERMGQQRARLIAGNEDGSGRRYSEDDVKAIETLMQQKGITDYQDGATLYAATLPPSDPKPTGYEAPKHGATWEFPEWAKFGPDPVGASRDTAHQVITEFMHKRR
jgi:hypothetical protein